MKNKPACVCLFVALLLHISAQAQPSVLHWIKRMRVIPTVAPLMEHLSRSNELPKIATPHPQSIRANNFLLRNWITTLSDLIGDIKALTPNDVPDWLCLANAYRHTDDPLAKGLAKFIYEYLIDNWQVTNAARSIAAIGLSKIYERQKEFQKSFNYAKYATVLNPNNGHAWHRLGDCIIGNFVEKWNSYREAFLLGAQEDDRELMSKAYVGMGAILESNADLQTAAFYFDMALHHDPNSDAARRGFRRVQRAQEANLRLLATHYSPVRD